MSDQAKKPKSKKEPARKQSGKTPPLKQDGLADAPILSGSEDTVLGTLGETETTHSAKETGHSIQKKSSQGTEQGPEGAQTPVPAVLKSEEEAEPVAEPLHLPRGAFIAFRKSGGLHFSSREMVLYPDGRIAYDTRGVPQKEYNRLRRAVNDGQMASLRKLLDQTGFWKETSRGEQNPDAFAYEIAARLGQRSNEIQVFEGSVDERLKPLVDQLTRLLPE